VCVAPCCCDTVLQLQLLQLMTVVALWALVAMLAVGDDKCAQDGWLTAGVTSAWQCLV
jgi:hypothetical protein